MRKKDKKKKGKKKRKERKKRERKKYKERKKNRKEKNNSFSTWAVGTVFFQEKERNLVPQPTLNTKHIR